MKDMIAAIRNDKKIGRGSCSVIDECYDTADLEKLLQGCTTVEDALAKAYKVEGLQREKALNQREGNDDDWQVAWYNELGDQEDYAEGGYCSRADEERGYVRGR